MLSQASLFSPSRATHRSDPLRGRPHFRSTKIKQASKHLLACCTSNSDTATTRFEMPIQLRDLLYTILVQSLLSTMTKRVASATSSA